jgi:hypothetical protein
MLGDVATALLFLWFVSPLLAFAVNLGSPRRLHPILLYVLTVIVGFLVLLAAASIADMHLKAEMDRFDLDGDGGLGGSELTPEAQTAIDDWASDTGRRMVIFTGIPISAIWFGICLFPLYVGRWIVTRSLFSGSTSSRQGGTEWKSSDSGNPFQPPAHE